MRCFAIQSSRSGRKLRIFTNNYIFQKFRPSIGLEGSEGTGMAVIALAIKAVAMMFMVVSPFVSVPEALASGRVGVYWDFRFSDRGNLGSASTHVR